LAVLEAAPVLLVALATALPAQLTLVVVALAEAKTSFITLERLTTVAQGSSSSDAQTNTLRCLVQG
jgi:hypothetical protein